MHPFDIKTVVLAKHAQHVVLIHFPIALFIIGVLFDFLAQSKKQPLLAAAAYYNLLVAAIATIPVVITGLVAWQWELEGQKLKGILLMHLVMGCASTVLIWTVCSSIGERDLARRRLCPDIACQSKLSPYSSSH